MADLIDRQALDLAFTMLRFNEDGTSGIGMIGRIGA